MKTPTTLVSALLLSACGGGPVALDDITSETIGTGTPPIDDVISLIEPDRLVGVGIAGTSGQVYGWTAANTVSAGIETNFAWTRSPYRFSTAPGRSAATIIASAIASDDRVYTWYSDGKHTVGQSANLDVHQNPIWYTIPGGRTPQNVVGIAIAKPSDFVFAWYDDGYVSVGHATDLGSRTGPGKYWESERAYTLAPGRTPDDVVDMAIEPALSHVFVWYRDGYASEGRSWDLDAYRGAFHYTRHGVLKSVYPANPPPLPSGPPLAVPPWSTAPPVAMVDVGTSSADNGVAAGHNYFAVALDASVRFYNRDGTPLTGGSLDDNSADLGAMFEPFKRSSPIGRIPRPLDVNHYLGFETPCDDASRPTTVGYRYCVSGGAYDTRVEYDAVGRRFVIVAQLRNYIWTTAFENDPTANLDNWPFQSGYSHAPQQLTNAPNDGVLARRLKIVAVSRTEDPRLGFHTYVFAQNNYRDWPWMSINGEWLVLSNRGNEHADGPAATLMHLPELRDGVERPQFVHYHRQELAGAIVAGPVRHHGTPHSLLIGVDERNTWRVFALGHPTQPYAKVRAEHTPLPMPGYDVIRERSVYRDGYLHVVDHMPRPGTSGFFDIDYYRYALTMSGNLPSISTTWASGYRTASWTDTAGGLRTYEEPVMQVNGYGDLLLLFGEASGGTASVPDRVFRVLWPANAAAPVAPVVWRSGQAGTSSHGDAIKALHMAVDPIDPAAFWAIHKVRDFASDWDTFVGTHKP